MKIHPIFANGRCSGEVARDNGIPRDGFPADSSPAFIAGWRYGWDARDARRGPDSPSRSEQSDASPPRWRFLET